MMSCEKQITNELYIGNAIFSKINLNVILILNKLHDYWLLSQQFAQNLND